MDTPDVLAWRDGYIEALDQTVLPHQVRVLRIGTVDQLVEAVTTLAVRGAPVLGAAGALGVALAVRQGGREGWDQARLDAAVKRIADSRPTAVNLRREVTAVAALIPQGRAAVEAAALAVVDSAVTASQQISWRGAAYLRQACGRGRLRVHTHCNTGSLARSEEHTSELQSRRDLVCRLLLEKKKTHKERIVPCNKTEITSRR